MPDIIESFLITETDTGFNYDNYLFFDIAYKCSTYEELLMQCDLNRCECIMTRKEFDNLKSNVVQQA